MKCAIVTDMRYRMALAPARTLAAAGYKVTGVEYDSTDEKLAIGFYSKHLADTRFLPSEESAFLKGLYELCREKAERYGEKPVLLPVGRRALTAVRDTPEMAEVADYIVPSEKAMTLADDKGRLYSLAQSVGVPAPKTAIASEYASLSELAADMSYPCFIKYRNGEALGLKPVQRYTVVKNAAELISAYDRMNKVDPDPIIQEYAPGHDVGIAAVTDKNGVLRDYLCYESLREFPATGGPTCLCRTVESPKMVEYAEKLLRELDYQGIAMLDFRGSPDNPKLLELNPRVWGSANIAEVAYSPLFVSYASASRNEEGRPAEISAPSYRVGKTMRFSPQFQASFLSYVKNGAPFVKTAGEYIKDAFDFSAKDGLRQKGDTAPFRRYILNLISGKQ